MRNLMFYSPRRLWTAAPMGLNRQATDESREVASVEHVATNREESRKAPCLPCFF